MLIRRPDPIRYSEVTPRSLFLSRRTMLAQVSAAILGTQIASAKLPALKKSGYSVSESPNKPDDVTRYNNFYEFGTQKSDPAENAKNFRTSPWTLSVEGAVGKPQKFSMDDILKVAPLEERIYRFRCVEGWSAIIPWAGFPLQELIKRVEPTSKAKYVAFETYYDAKQMPQARGSGIQFPYVEGLRLDEAMHPLTLLTVGMYGDSLPPQNGAPVRLIVPWKYGFKSAKSLVKIRLVEKQPPTSWNLLGPQEYGFYSNVNPAVAHPRWSQATERRLGEFGRRKTLPFNGYADQVASLYQGLDLVKNY